MTANVVELSERRARVKVQIEWLNDVAADVRARKISSSAFLLAFHLNRYGGNDAREAWPSQETLAADVGLSVRAVRGLVGDLAKRDHLEVVPGRGRGSTSRYRLISRKPVSGFIDENQEEDFRSTPTESGTKLPPLPSKSGNLTHEKRKFSARKAEASFLQKDLKKDTKKDSTCSPEGIESEFDAWYKAYPLHKARRKAQSTYERVIAKRQATHQQLLDGAKRYANEQRGKDPRFTKHPTTWLNGGCWTDEPDAPAAASPTAGSHAGLVFDGVRHVRPMGAV